MESALADRSDGSGLASPCGQSESLRWVGIMNSPRLVDKSEAFGSAGLAQVLLTKVGRRLFFIPSGLTLVPPSLLPSSRLPGSACQALLLLPSLPQSLFSVKMITQDLTSPVAAIQLAAGAFF